MEVESMITSTPSHSAFFGGGGLLISLAFDAQVHDVITANGTRVDLNIPRPQSYRVPFLDLEFLLDGLCGAGGGGRSSCGGYRSVGHYANESKSHLKCAANNPQQLCLNEFSENRKSLLCERRGYAQPHTTSHKSKLTPSTGHKKHTRINSKEKEIS